MNHKLHQAISAIAITYCFLFLPCFAVCQPTHPGDKKPAPQSPLIRLSPNEDNAINEILAFFGGECEYGIEKKAFSPAHIESSFFIKLRKSPAIDSLKRDPELCGSKIAYLFYKNLDKEKEHYDHIEAQIILPNGRQKDFSYSLASLEKVKSKLKLVEKLVNLIRVKKIDEIKNYILTDTSLFNFNKDYLVNNIKKAEAEYGDAGKYIMYGFKYLTAKNGKVVLDIAGFIKRGDRGTALSVYLDPQSEKDEVYALNYTL
jgi:hypothetical protein